MSDDRTTQARWLALMAITALAVYLTWLMLKPFLGVILWAAVLVLTFYPVHAWILSRTKRPALSAVLSVLLVMALVIVPLSLMATALVHELTSLVSTVQPIIQDLLDHPEQHPLWQKVLDFIKPYFDLDKALAPDSIKAVLARVTQPVLSGALSILGGALGVAIQIFLILFVSFYLFRDGDQIARRLPDLLPLDRERAVALLERTRTVINASVNGVLAIAALQGMLGGLMFWILGLPSPLVWGVSMAILALLPVGGATLIWLPAAAILALTGHWVKGLILFIFGIAVISTVDNILRPRLVGGKTGMHDLMIFFSVLGGLKLFGAVGLLLGPVVLAITMSLLAIYRREEEPAEEA
jgi:predicted PurR-regulated permease PerM